MWGVNMLSVGELGKKLVEAGRLKLRPLCVYVTDEIPQDAVPSYKIDRCIARVAYSGFRRKNPLFTSKKVMSSVAAVGWCGCVLQNRILD
jgi:hypothetical protein